MTRARFSYSEIRGSKLAWQLLAAYRSLQRPSSASSAKASTGCPLQLAETMLALAMEFSRVDVDPIRRLGGPPREEAVRFAPGPDPANGTRKAQNRSLQSCTVCPTQTHHWVPAGHDCSCELSPRRGQGAK
jgi:hypothetical protein